MERLSLIQKPDGGFASYGIETAESCAQVVTALCALGMDPDSLVQDGNSVVDALLRYGNGDGSFRHLQDGQRDQMATEQAFYALAAWKRMGSGSLYQMERRVPVHPDVHIPAAALPGTTFPDLPEDGTAILELAERGIINGKGNGMFDPEAGMTRAEFAAITVRALGLEPGTTDAFSDVQADVWYAPWIGTATRYGIVNGVGGGKFSPETAITWQEAAVMVSRAARLAGMETEGDTRTTLKPAEAPGDWALSGVAFAYREGLLTEISPRQVISRADLAEMLYRMLCVCGAMT